MKTNSLKLTVVALCALIAGNTTASEFKDTILTWVPKDSANVQLAGSKQGQRAMDFVRNAMLCSAVANTISKNNNIARVGIGAASSFLGTLALCSSYESKTSDLCPSKTSGTEEDSDKKQMQTMQTFIVWGLYAVGQNFPQILDFLKDATYRKNIVSAILDTLFANRDRSEWLAIFIRNFGPLFMHYAPAGQFMSNGLFEVPGKADTTA